MEKKLVDEIKLKNGLTLLLYDRSKLLAGDRWLIALEAYMEVEVKPEYLEGELSARVGGKGQRRVTSKSYQGALIAEPPERNLTA